MRIAVLIVLSLGVLFSSNTLAQKSEKGKFDGWTVLGSKRVDNKIEKDVLKVGVNKGGFNKLKIKATGGTVYMIKMVVTYGNGTKEEVPLKHVFRKGDASRVIDLKGNTRIIKHISFIYDRKNNSKKAKIWVAGKR